MNYRIRLRSDTGVKGHLLLPINQDLVLGDWRLLGLSAR